MRNRAPSGTTSTFIVALTVVSLHYGSASAETLELNDGTVIQGEIKSLQNGVYTVETSALGTVRVPQQNVRTIDQSSGDTAGSPARESLPSQPEIEAMQLRIIQDPNLLAMLLSLQNDPEVQAILADPEIMGALAAGDLAALMDHPKIIALTRNAHVREFMGEVQ